MGRSAKYILTKFPARPVYPPQHPSFTSWPVALSVEAPSPPMKIGSASSGSFPPDLRERATHATCGRSCETTTTQDHT